MQAELAMLFALAAVDGVNYGGIASLDKNDTLR